MNVSGQTRHVVVVGGGVSGLACAFYLQQQAEKSGCPVHITLLEASDHLGGAIHSVRRGEYLFEEGPDNFITTTPDGLELAKAIGLEDQIIHPQPAGRRAMVVRRGRLVPIPVGFQLVAPTKFWPLLTSPIFSPLGKLRIMLEPFIAARKDGEDESLASFVTRRFGRQALDRLVQPLVGGIYTADPRTLSVRSTLGRFADLERTHGSVLRGLWAKRKSASNDAADPNAAGARYGLFISFKEGMSSFIEALVNAVRQGGVQVRPGCPVKTLKRIPDDAPSKSGAGRWRLGLEDGADLAADDLVLALPAWEAARLLGGVEGAPAQELSRIQYASSVVVNLAYERHQWTRPVEAFGFVVPHDEGRSIIAGSFTGAKYAGREPGDGVLVRLFLGGSLQPELVELGEEKLAALAMEEARQLLGFTGPPLWRHVRIYRRAMPQYQVGHQALVERIRSMLQNLPGLRLIGNGYDGVGIPECIRGARVAAESLGG